MTSYTDSRYGCKWKPRKVSAKRDFPHQFYDVTDETQCVKKHKGCESQEGSYNGYVGPVEGSADKGLLDFIPLDTESESESESESLSSESCGSGRRSSNYDIIPRIVNAAACGWDEGIEKLGVYNEVRIHGVCLKEIRWFETEDGLKIELSVEKLKEKKKSVDDGLFGRACESVGDNVTNESVSEEVCSHRRQVAAVRSYPPGCGRVMKIA